MFWQKCWEIAFCRDVLCIYRTIRTGRSFITVEAGFLKVFESKKNRKEDSGMFPDGCFIDIVRCKNGLKVLCRYPDGFVIQYFICGRQVFAAWRMKE